MKESDAARVVSMLAAYFPGKDITDETAVLWERQVAEFEQQDAVAAAESLGTMGRFMPSLAEFVDAIREERNHRLIARALTLPEPVPYPSDACTFEEFLRDRPDMQERVKKLGIWKETLARLEA